MPETQTIDQIVDQLIPETPAEGGAPEQTPTPAGADHGSTQSEPTQKIQQIIARAKAGEAIRAEEIEAAHKEWEAGATPKFQEAAELRKTLEGLTPEEIQELKALKSMTPEQRAEYYWSKWEGTETPTNDPDPGPLWGPLGSPHEVGTSPGPLWGPLGSPHEVGTSPLDDYVPTTDEGALLYKTVLELKQKIEQIEQPVNHYTAAQANAAVDAAFSAFSTRIGTEIPPAERLEIEQEIIDLGMVSAIGAKKLSIEQAIEKVYKARTYDQHYQAGVNHASRIVEEKTGIPASPSDLNARTGTPTPKDFDDHFDLAWQKAGLPN
jgi:hypothetical protein